MSTSAVYIPDNEPYLGRETVFAFDNAIIASMNANDHIAPYTHKIEKSDLQWAACQIIPQGISLALSIRELVRQGYLFGALVLTRSLVERAATILYLHHNPQKVEIWKRGWKYNERPDYRTESTDADRKNRPMPLEQARNFGLRKYCQNMTDYCI